MLTLFLVVVVAVSVFVFVKNNPKKTSIIDAKVKEEARKIKESVENKLRKK